MPRVAVALSVLAVATGAALALGRTTPLFQDFPDSVVAQIPVGGDPTNVSALPNAEYLYVGNETTDYVTVVRLTDRTVVARVAAGQSPWELMAHPSGDYVYTGDLNSNSVSVIRTSDNTVIAAVPVGESPCQLAFRPAGDFAYVANSASNNVSVIRTSDDSVVATVRVGDNPRGIACLPDGNYVYTANCYSGNVSGIRTSDNTVVATVHVGGEPHRVAALLDGSHVYVTRRGDNKVLVIRTSDNTLVDSLVSGASACGMVMLPGSEFAYVANIGDNTVSVIRTSTNTLVTTIPVGHTPWGVTAPAAGDFVYTSDRSGQSVTVIGYRRRHDVCPVLILAPTGTLDSGTSIVPRVVVKNLGISADVFPVTLCIGAGYTGTVQDTLPAGFSDTVSFPAWTAAPAGRLPVVCFTGLQSDEDTANDTLTDSVLVLRASIHDVSAVSITVPAGTVDFGTVCIPQAVVRNLGRQEETFPVTMQIGVAYSQSVSESLAAGISDTVSFPAWTATPTGVLPVTCFTALVGDENPTNDTINDSVRVVGPPVHDVGAVAILSPTGTVYTGDTVIPRARISNFGNTAERFFDVRFRIGPSYDRTVSVTQTLQPDSTVELTFEPWVAEPGNRVVSCSTMLTSDANRANDKVASTVRAFQQTALHIEHDQSDRLEVGQGKTYQFHALIDGDAGGVVEVAQPLVPAGWSLRLLNENGTNELTDTDADGMPDLGYVMPGESCWFSLEVKTPSGLVGDTASLAQRTFLVAGQLGNDPAVADTAFLNLTLVPGFSVHNFPNPFIIRTAFVIGLPGDGKVTLTVYTRAGKRVCRVLENADMPAGVHFVGWDGVNDNGRGIAPGTYEYLLDYVHAGKTDRIRKRLVLTRE